METFDLPSPWTVGVIGGLILLLATSCIVGVPLGIYREAWRHNRSSWNASVRTELTKGAYRGMVVALPIRVQIPRIVVVASASSLFLAMPMVLALSIVFVGVCDELARRHIGPAMVFGVEGALLTIAIGAIGVTLTHRSRTVARAARVVALWELGHALVLACAVMASSAWPSGGAWGALAFEGGGRLLAPYAIVASLHASLLLLAARAQTRVAMRVARPVSGERVTLRSCA